MENLLGYKIDRIISICGLGIVAFLFLRMEDYPEEAKILPAALLVCAGLLFCIMAFQSFVMKKDKERKLAGVPIVKMLLIILASILYFVFIVRLGFYLSSWLFFIFITTWLNREQNTIFTWVLGTIFVIVLYFVFCLLLKVPLPRGAFI